MIEVALNITDQLRFREDYKKALGAYVCKPFGQRDLDRDLEDELDYFERWMLDNPGLSKGPNGKWRRRRKGLLEESQSRFKPRLILPEAAGIPTVPVAEWDDLVSDEDAVDIRQFSKSTLDQKNVGSCASESSAGSMMNVRGFMNLKHVRFNPYFAYHTVSGGSDRGSTLPDNIAFAQDFGIASQDVWPRSKGWRQRPSIEAYEDAKNYRLLEVVRIRTWEEFGSMLLYGHPVYFGYSGHAVYAVQLLSRTRLVYHNSWGSDWGDGGFGSLSSNSIYWNYGVYGILSVVHS